MIKPAIIIDNLLKILLILPWLWTGSKVDDVLNVVDFEDVDLDVVDVDVSDVDIIVVVDDVLDVVVEGMDDEDDVAFKMPMTAPKDLNITLHK